MQGGGEHPKGFNAKWEHQYREVGAQTYVSENGDAGNRFSFKRGILVFFPVRSHSTLIHLLPLRFYCVGGCWDRTQDCYSIVCQTYSARSHPFYFHLLGQANNTVEPPPPPYTLDALTLLLNNFGGHPLSRPRIVKNASEYANAVCFVWWKDLAPSPPFRYQQCAGALPVKISIFGIFLSGVPWPVLQDKTI